MTAPAPRDATPRAMGWLVLPARVALAGLFLFAGSIKLRNPQHFVQAIMAFKSGLPDHLAHLAAFAVPWTEALAGLALLLGLWTRAAALLLSALLIVFVALLASVLIRGMDVHCSCFGKFEIPCTGAVGWCHLARNAVLLAMTLVVLVWGPGPLTIDRAVRG